MRTPHDPPEWVTELIWRLVSWLDAGLRCVAEADLRAEGLVPREPPVAVEAPPIKVSAALRSRTTVLDCDAVLADGRPDWAELAAEHRRKPFGRVQRRALIARRDCPDELTRALLTPWDSLVAVRLGDRGQPIPRWVWETALARVGETRHTFVRQAVSEEAVREQILATSRLDLFVRAVADVDTPKTAMFWKGVGGLLRQWLGDDRAAWPTAAAVLTAHTGTFESLLHRIEQTPVARSPQDADLRVLVHAPDALLAEVISELSDEALERMGKSDRGPGHARNSHLSSMIVKRIFEASIPPRGVFARWAHAARARSRASARRCCWPWPARTARCPGPAWSTRTATRRCRNTCCARWPPGRVSLSRSRGRSRAMTCTGWRPRARRPRGPPWPPGSPTTTRGT
ncbi:hypothetical protein [Nonomuraea sp. SYSU D8015]|uniref:hypothetical protein n=1 Tax=Nonomuraea sp. SYSU D8015 TaxID=2593644 RepID=UPI0016606BDC|nr:hypothetical protein [Nonomuraea sp. SYSU D8015]